MQFFTHTHNDNYNFNFCKNVFGWLMNPILAQNSQPQVVHYLLMKIYLQNVITICSTVLEPCYNLLSTSTTGKKIWRNKDKLNFNF